MADLMSGKTVLVTGASDGIGRQTALELALMGARVIAHARNAARGAETLAALRTQVPQAAFELAVGDLSSLVEVRALADNLANRFDQLDVLINNAGVKPITRQISADGYELTLAVNHLAHFLLTIRLLSLLRRAPGARVVTVSSVSHYRGTINFDDLQLTRGWDSYRSYAQSKLANVLFAYELARRLAPDGISSNALHPGVVSTKLLVEGFGAQGGDSLHQGAATSVYLASSPEVAGRTGRFFQDRAEQEPAPASHNREWQTRLWQVSEQLTGARFG